MTGTPARGVEVRRPEASGAADDKGDFDGVSLWDNPPEGIRTWPRPVTTDDQGRFTLHGIGRGVRPQPQRPRPPLCPAGPAHQPGRASAAKEITLALEPARIIEGRVLAADTGRPIPNAVVSASAHGQNEHADGIFTAKFRADDQGRFTMNPTPATITPWPPSPPAASRT